MTRAFTTGEGHELYAFPQTQCPSCGAWVDDLDGFGVLFHEDCGYCSHPDVYGGTCQACGEENR